MRNKRLLVLMVCFVALSSMVFAGFKVHPTKGFDVDVTVDVPEVKMVKTTIDGQAAVEVSMSEGTLTQGKGFPQLPLMSAFVMVAPGKTPELKVTKGQFQVIDLAGRVVSSKGPLTRNIDPKTVPYTWSEVYGRDAWYPTDNQIAFNEEPFQFRDVHGVRLVICPVQYNPAKNQLRVYKTFNVKVLNRGDVRRLTSITPSFEPMYEKFFLNFRSAASRLPRLNENGRLLIISPDEFEASVQPLLAWKLKSGIDAKIVKLSEIGAAPLTAAAIKEFIQKDYDKGNLVHIILVGDAQQLPTLKGVKENADSDPCYTKLAGADHVPDAMISRISATTAEGVAYQVAKFINYEQFPTVNDAAWYLQAMGIASAEGNPTDFARCNELRDVLLKARFTSVDQIYDGKGVPEEETTAPVTPANPTTPSYPPYMPGFPGGPGYPHLPPMIDYVMAPYDNDTGWVPGGSAPVTPVTKGTSATAAQVAKAANEGRSLINYIGHGSDMMWVTSRFGVADCKKLTNGAKQPYIIDVACVNGNFVKNAECFAEAWMRAGTIETPAGAIGVTAASTNMEWVPPCIVQAEMSSVYIAKNEYKTAGGILMNGIIKGLEQYGTTEKGSGVMMYEQWHLFGDSTLNVRTNPPVALKAEGKALRAEGVVTAEVVVLGADGNPIKDARVAVYTEGVKNMGSALTNAEGKATVTISATAETPVYYTVTGGDLVPVVDQKL